MGFLLLAVGFCLVAMGCITLLLDSPGRAAAAALLVVGGLAAVAAEALWCCRPWCKRVATAWALLGSLPLAAGMVAFLWVAVTGSAAAVVPAVLLLLPLGLIYLLWSYVRRRVDDLFGGSP